ncbi:MAG: hypothetical protein QOH53_384 [Ilumatobacteraceae bacterium]|jgi:hypothetical protein
MPLRIETDRLILTPEEPSDVEWFAELLNARGTSTFTIADALKRIDVMTETIETTGIGALVLRFGVDFRHLRAAGGRTGHAQNRT